jgi:hypothetical protein
MLGQTCPHLFETGGFTEANGNQGWPYFKLRPVGQSAPQPPQPGTAPARAQPQANQQVTRATGTKLFPRKYLAEFARQQGVTPEQAERDMKAAGWTVVDAQQPATKTTGMGARPFNFSKSRRVIPPFRY